MRTVQVNSVCIHEASHAITAMAFGYAPALVWANESGGRCVIGASTIPPVWELVINAAGYAAGIIVKPFTIETDEPQAPSMTSTELPMSDDDLSATSLAMEFEKMERDGAVSPTIHDHRRIEEIVEGLLARGEILPRTRLVDRWHSRAMLRAWTILERNKTSVMKLAAALAVRGALTAKDISELIPIGGAGATFATAPSLTSEVA